MRLAPARKVVSVLLAALLIFVPILEINAAAVNLEDIILIIWSAMKACGVQIAGTTSSVISFLGQELSDYAESIGSTVYNVISGVRYSVNSLGEFLLNDTFVDLIDSFITYLTNKYNLSDNQSKTLQESHIHIGSITSYALPIEICEPQYNYYQQ